MFPKRTQKCDLHSSRSQTDSAGVALLIDGSAPARFRDSISNRVPPQADGPHASIDRLASYALIFNIHASKFGNNLLHVFDPNRCFRKVFTPLPNG